jgi:hypothetical protein
VVRLLTVPRVMVRALTLSESPIVQTSVNCVIMQREVPETRECGLLWPGPGTVGT